MDCRRLHLCVRFFRLRFEGADQLLRFEGFGRELKLGLVDVDAVAGSAHLEAHSPRLLLEHVAAAFGAHVPKVGPVRGPVAFELLLVQPFARFIKSLGRPTCLRFRFRLLLRFRYIGHSNEFTTPVPIVNPDTMATTKRNKKWTGPRVDRLIQDLTGALGKAKLPSVSEIARDGRDPYRILISTVLSLRTKDEVTVAASKRLFEQAPDARALSALPVRIIERAIYPAGFYKTKARNIKQIAKDLLNKHGGVVPDSMDELLAFKGVGRKTATLVLSLGYGQDAICVDTHVHRISNRLGLVDTDTPERTEFALMELLPRRHWIGINEALVRFGQQICKPVSPWCSQCSVVRQCPRIGVGRHR